MSSLENQTRVLSSQYNETTRLLTQILDRNARLSEENLNLTRTSVGLLEENVELITENQMLQRQLDALRAQSGPLASWVIFREGNSTFVRDTKIDQVVFVGEAADAIQYAVDKGGLCYLVTGRYNMSHGVTMSNSSGIIGDGRGTQLYLSSGAEDLIVMPPGAMNCIISDLSLNGNKANNSAGSGIVIYGYSWKPIIQHVIISDFAEYGLVAGGSPGEYVYEPLFFDIFVRNCGLDGLNFGYCSDAFGMNIYSEGNAGAGIQHHDVAGTWIHEHSTYNFGEYGIVVGPSATDLRLSETHVDKNQQNGMILRGSRNTLTGAFIFNSGTNSTTRYDGLILEDATNCIVSGCIITDYQPVKTQRRAIVETGRSDNNTITGNDLSGNIEQSIIIGSHDEVSGNIGYQTENQGTATVVSGASSVRVEHGLQLSPTLINVNLTPATSLSNCTQFWVSDVDALGFTIYLDGNCDEPVDFAWSVDRHR